MLRTRILTAAVGVPLIFLIFIFGGEIGALCLFFAAVLVSLFEYYSMAFPRDLGARALGVLGGAAVFLAWGLGIIYESNLMVFPGPLVFSIMLIFFYFLFRIGDMQTVASRVGLGVLGILYVDLLAVHMQALCHFERGWRYVILLMAVVWANDTGGYFAGRFLGRHKFYERVSPKKTWEGSIGGALLGFVFVSFFNWILSTGFSLGHLITVSLVVGYVGQLGDLCESLLKRSFGIKDSGFIIPGHGGILDRIDALLFGAPVFYYFAWLVVGVA